jgi:cyclase
MLKVRIIPCLDVKEGRVVKGVKFVDLIDAGDPVEAAKAYDAAGADELCFLDIRASHEDRSTLRDLVRRTAEACFMPLTVGGGVRTVEDVVALLASGADKVLLNTAAHADRSLITRAAEKVGAQAIVVNIDGTRMPDAAPRWQVFSHVGHRALAIDAVAYAEEVARLGAGEILVTSKDRDGTRAGYDVELIRAVADAVGVPVIASGGAGTLEHLVDGVRKGRASAVLAASMFHFGTFTIGAAKRHMAAAGIPVRLDGLA